MNKYTCLNSGDKIGEFTFLKYVPKINKEISGLVVCPLCGNQFEVGLSRIGLGYTKSCGCIANKGRIIHGGATKLGRTTEYKTWCDMRRRCFDKKYEQYMDYGGRGIIVCERWLGKQGFINFLSDMGKKPSLKHSIERINNNGNYEPANCKWATKKEQGRNRRNNRYLEYNGERKLISDWAEDIGVPSCLLTKRLSRGWSVEMALTTPRNNTKKIKLQYQEN